MIQINILSKDKKIYRGKGIAVTLPGKDGEFQILENHAPTFSLLKKGKILVIQTQKRFVEIPIKGGCSRVLNNEVIILVQQ